MERRLAAILVADLVGYSRLVGIDEEGTLAALKALRSEVIEPLIARYHGRVVKYMGDGFLVEFQSAIASVECAIAWQTQVDQFEHDQSLAFRIGINLGDIIIDDNDIHGNGVNIAARLEAIGAAGQVVISDEVYRHVKDRVETDFHDNGAIALKNIANPVRVWSWRAGLPYSAQPIGTGEIPGIYVADFETRDDECAGLADEIKFELETTFARQSGLSLTIDRDAADFHLIGSIRGHQGRWRISARLVDQSRGEVIWSERFEESGEDKFDILDRCVTRISGAVRIRLPGILGSRLSVKNLQQMTTQDLLNHAMHRHFTPTPDSWDAAIPALELALEREAENWMAMAMLSFNLFTRIRIFEWQKISSEKAEKARTLINNAHRLKPGSEVVRYVHGAFMLYVDRDHEAARMEAEEALGLNPNYYHSIDLMSQIEAFSGGVRRARELAKRTAGCDPGYPYRHLYQRSLAYVEAVDGNYAEAANMFRRANRAVPGLPQNLVGMVVCSALAGDAEGSRKAVETLLSLEPDFDTDAHDPWPFENLAKWEHLRETMDEAIRECRVNQAQPNAGY